MGAMVDLICLGQAFATFPVVNCCRTRAVWGEQMQARIGLGIIALFLLTTAAGAGEECARDLTEEAKKLLDPKPIKQMKVGECRRTTLVAIRPRLENCGLGPLGKPTAFAMDPPGDCGIAVWYAFRDMQASYTTDINVKDTWCTGDPIRICLIDWFDMSPERPYAKYRATNLRTKTTYEEDNRF